MGRWESFMARDGHEFSGWLTAPERTPRGAVVILPEIFGTNAHIRQVADGYAADGYLAIAPALYDRIARRLELGYTPEQIQLARGYKLEIKTADVLADMAAAVNVVRHAGKVALIGYCWGGHLAFLGAAQLPVNAGVAYYGSGISGLLAKPPGCPMLFHYAERDHNIPLSEVDAVRAGFPQGEFHLYSAEHGFNCNQRASYHEPSAKLARERTLEFLARTVG